MRIEERENQRKKIAEWEREREREREREKYIYIYNNYTSLLQYHPTYKMVL